VVDKEGRRVSDSPLNSGIVLGNVAAIVLKAKGKVNWTPDKKFVNPSDTARYLDAAVRVAASKDPSGFLVMKEPADSQREGLVQLADFYYQIVKKKVVSEGVVLWKDLKADYIKKQER